MLYHAAVTHHSNMPWLYQLKHLQLCRERQLSWTMFVHPVTKPHSNTSSFTQTTSSISQVVMTYDKAGDRKDGQGRKQQTRIINTFFQRQDGQLIPQPGHPLFKEIEERQETKYCKDEAEGSLSSLEQHMRQNIQGIFVIVWFCIEMHRWTPVHMVCL